MTLPAGWEARTDPQSGRTYYQNILTKATQWEPPVAPPPPPPHAGIPGPGQPGRERGCGPSARPPNQESVALLLATGAIADNCSCGARIACTERCMHLTRRCSNHGLLPCTRDRLAFLWVEGHTRSSTARSRDLWERVTLLTWGENSDTHQHASRTSAGLWPHVPGTVVRSTCDSHCRCVPRPPPLLFSLLRLDAKHATVKHPDRCAKPA